MVIFKDEVYETCETEPQINDLVIDGHGDVGYLDYKDGVPIIKDNQDERIYQYLYCLNPKKLIKVEE